MNDQSPTLTDLIDTLEILKQAVIGKDRTKSFEAVTVLLMQFVDAFGAQSPIFRQSFPVLEDLKDSIQREDFETSIAITLALLARLRQALGTVARKN